MPDAILIIDDEAEEHRSLLVAEFPGIAVHTARARDGIGAPVGEVTALIAFGSRLDDEFVSRLSRLAWLQFLSSGTDPLARLPSLGKQVVVTSAHGIHGPPVSEMAIFHMLSLARDAPRLLRNKSEGRWDPFKQPLLHGKTVAIVGTGVIAQALAGRCSVFGMTVLGVSAAPRDLPHFDRVAGRDSLADVAGEADFLVLLTALTDATRDLVNARILAAMKPTAYVINLGRGALCDEDALLAALHQRRIAGVGLDAFRTEPLASDHPFWRLDNVFITPHMGGASDSYPELVLPILRANVACFLERRWDGMVNRVVR
jgi:phosphoglycerate dehydrogenase-like enzyme